MSGHSKWSSIKYKKGIADAKRSAIFTKLAKAITIAAREGGKELDTNFKLRLAVDKAKVANMPKDNIERAIKRGTGELDGGRIEEVTYEGFGPSGVAIVVSALTDNRNRTSANIKHIFSKYGGSLGGPNSVLWMFERKGVIRISSENLDMSWENLELKVIDLGAEDTVEEDGEMIIYTAPDNLQSFQESLEKEGIKVDYAEIEWIAKEKIDLLEEDEKKVKKFLGELDDDQDVDNYYTNIE